MFLRVLEQGIIILGPSVVPIGVIFVVLAVCNFIDFSLSLACWLAGWLTRLTGRLTWFAGLARWLARRLGWKLAWLCYLRSSTGGLFLFYSTKTVLHHN